MNFEDFLALAETTNKRHHGELIARLIVDVKKQQILFVPSGMNHPEFLADYLKTTLLDIEQSPEKVNHFVGASLNIVSNQIIEIIVGISGLETWLRAFKKPFHLKSQINQARSVLINFIISNNIPLMKDYALRMVYL